MVAPTRLQSQRCARNGSRWKCIWQMKPLPRRTPPLRKHVGVEERGAWYGCDVEFTITLKRNGAEGRRGGVFRRSLLVLLRSRRSSAAGARVGSRPLMKCWLRRNVPLRLPQSPSHANVVVDKIVYVQLGLALRRGQPRVRGCISKCGTSLVVGKFVFWSPA